MIMSLEDAVVAFWDNPDNRGRTIQAFRWISYGMVVLGYLIMGYLLYLELA